MNLTQLATMNNIVDILQHSWDKTSADELFLLVCLYSSNQLAAFFSISALSVLGITTLVPLKIGSILQIAQRYKAWTGL